jgi:activator of HSP90 ATPase
MKQAVRSALLPAIFSILQQFPRDLLAENGSTILVEAPKTTQKKVESASQAQAAPKATEAKPAAVRTTTVKTSSELKASASELYECLTNLERLAAWTMDGHLTFENHVGGTFSLLHGAISGKNVELVPGKKIVQEWRLKSWPQNHHSRLTIEFKEGGDSTMVHITQENVPKSEEEAIRANWDRMYFDRIKQAFGYVI